MEVNDNGAGGAAQTIPSGDSENEKAKDKGKVDYDTYLKTLNQLKSTKQKNQEYESLLSSIETEKKLREEEDLVKKQKFEELLQRRNAEVESERKARAETEARLKQVEKDRLDSIKLGAFYDKLGGKVKRREYLSFVDLDAIEVDESGTINEESVMRSVNAFMTDHHHLVETKTKVMPNEASRNYNGKISYDQWLKMPLKEKKKYSPKDILH